jgi:hypothetical protein
VYYSQLVYSTVGNMLQVFIMHYLSVFSYFKTALIRAMYFEHVGSIEIERNRMPFFPPSKSSYSLYNTIVNIAFFLKKNEQISLTLFRGIKNFTQNSEYIKTC